jgi:hypothetical protein
MATITTISDKETCVDVSIIRVNLLVWNKIRVLCLYSEEREPRDIIESLRYGHVT